jgi:hypothetical protein
MSSVSFASARPFGITTLSLVSEHHLQARVDCTDQQVKAFLHPLHCLAESFTFFAFCQKSQTILSTKSYSRTARGVMPMLKLTIHFTPQLGKRFNELVKDADSASLIPPSY